MTAVDIHSDGKWVIATCKTHLLLIDIDNQTTNGFSKTIPIKQRKAPIKLSIRPDHLAQLSINTVNFTPAKFYGNFILTSTGNYLFAWDFKKSKIGKNSYQIQEYMQQVIGEQSYRTGQVVVALEDQLVLANKKEFKTPQKLFTKRDGVVKSFI